MAQSAVGNFFRAGLFAVPVIIAFHDVIGSPVEVAGSSMQPEINPHLGPQNSSSGDVDVVWQDKLSISRHIYERGSIVVFRNPFDPKERVVKRLIGVDGDWVRPRGNKYDVLRVPEGCCWVEGDNYGVSEDSNHFGPVSQVCGACPETRVCFKEGNDTNACAASCHLPGAGGKHKQHVSPVIACCCCCWWWWWYGVAAANPRRHHT